MLGDRIKLVRKSNKYSQVEFGGILNVSKQTVSNWENNNIQPSVDILKDMAIKFNVSSDFLLEIDDRLSLYVSKGLPIEMVTHLQYIANDMQTLFYKAEEKHDGENSDMR